MENFHIAHFDYLDRHYKKKIGNYQNKEYDEI